MGQTASRVSGWTIQLPLGGRLRHPFALHAAAKKGSVTEVVALLHAQADLHRCNESGCTPLHFAAREGHVEVLELLLKAGARVNVHNVAGSTPLHWAADEGHSTAARRLCEGGADTEHRTRVGSTALHLAAKKGHTEIVRLLVEYGADLNAANNDRRTPAHLAARYGHVESLEVFLTVDISCIVALDKDGRMPLHLAALGGHQANYEKLLDAGSDSTACDRSGATAVDLARGAGLHVTDSSLQHQAVRLPQQKLSGMAEELMQRLDPRLKYLVAQDALDTLEEDISQTDVYSGLENEDEDEEGDGMFATLSGVKLQFDWELVRWERPAEMLLRQSLRGSVAVQHLKAKPGGTAPITPVHASYEHIPAPLFSTRRQQQRYRLVPYDELRSATNYFSPGMLLGQGGFGSVYSGRLQDGTDVAIKTLDSSGLQGADQFQCEVKVLSRVNHPNVVRLLASCPSHGCLVYELLPNGSLQDRLECLDNKPPLSWQTRICIACEMASGLLFLHNCKPEAILHRDFKPANVLLDEYFSVKLGDVGLARVAPELVSSMQLKSTVQDSMPVGTFHYLDPEYARTGHLSRKSDVYSLGISMLQLLTGGGPKGVVESVEAALENGTLSSVLDVKAGNWRLDIAEVLARLALSATEMRRKHRPDLEVEVLPVLRDLRNRVLDEHLETVLSISSVRLRQGADEAPRPPSHFICPISQTLMVDPVVASDGYVYDRSSLARWMEESAVSPMTNSRLEESVVVEAVVLRDAIDRWRKMSLGSV